VEGYLQERHLRRRLVYVGSHLLGLSPIVAATDLIATVPEEAGRIFAAHPELRQAEPPQCNLEDAGQQILGYDRTIPRQLHLS